MAKEGKKLSVPREMKEIEQEYQQQCYQAGSLQYQIKILNKELDNINGRIEAINKEAAARKQLDKQKEAANG